MKSSTEQPTSPVFQQTGRLNPRVTQPSSPWTVVAGLVGACVIGLVVFNSLSQGRAHAQASKAPVAPPAPASTAPPPVQTAPPPAPTMMPQPAPVMLAPQPNADADQARLRAPSVVVDLNEPEQTVTAAAPARLASQGVAPPAAAGAEDARLNAEERFAARVISGQADTAKATRLRDLARMAPQGTVIAAVLETAINSDLPGSVRAVVSRDVRGFDGSLVLIPRGSKLIGQYKSAVAIGQTRAFVVWSRIITPQGVSIDVASPATDQLGRGGLDGETDNHFFRRFGASILLTVLSSGLDSVGRGSNGSSNTLVIGSSVQASHVADIALQKQIDIPATIKVAQGTPLQVFVARDLDFSGVTP